MTMILIKFLRPAVFGLLLGATLCAQNQARCPLATAKNGDSVTLIGEAVHSAHDGLIRIAGCEDEVLFEYADDPNFRTSKLSLNKDESFRKFVEYFNADLKSDPNVTCRECWKYRVNAQFVGRLDVAESAGLARNAKTGKVMVLGFGHPSPFTRYRLVITAISKVVATEK
jgi:hypothetical protein